MSFSAQSYRKLADYHPGAIVFLACTLLLHVIEVLWRSTHWHNHLGAALVGHHIAEVTPPFLSLPSVALTDSCAGTLGVGGKPCIHLGACRTFRSFGAKGRGRKIFGPAGAIGINEKPVVTEKQFGI